MTTSNLSYSTTEIKQPFGFTGLFGTFEAVAQRLNRGLERLLGTAQASTLSLRDAHQKRGVQDIIDTAYEGLYISAEDKERLDFWLDSVYGHYAQDGGNTAAGRVIKHPLGKRNRDEQLLAILQEISLKINVLDNEPGWLMQQINDLMEMSPEQRTAYIAQVKSSLNEGLTALANAFSIGSQPTAQLATARVSANAGFAPAAKPA